MPKGDPNTDPDFHKNRRDPLIHPGELTWSGNVGKLICIFCDEVMQIHYTKKQDLTDFKCSACGATATFK